MIMEIEELKHTRKKDMIKVSIEIECETEQQILAHLSKITSVIKKQIKFHNGVLTMDQRITDFNCYGEHMCEISLPI